MTDPRNRAETGDVHPVDALKEIVQKIYPGREVDEESFEKARKICDGPAGGMRCLKD